MYFRVANSALDQREMAYDLPAQIFSFSSVPVVLYSHTMASAGTSSTFPVTLDLSVF